MKADAAPRSREATFTATLLLVGGATLVAGMIGIDWLKGSALQLGSIQAAGLGLGVASILLGIALLRSSLARRVAVFLWPFGVDGPAPPLHILSFALWLAVVSGLLEVGLHYWQFESGQRWGTLNPNSVWMVPLANAVTFTLLGAAFAFFAWLGLPHLGSPRLVTFLLLLLAVGAPLSLYSRELRWISVGLLSLGVAFQGSRWIVARREGSRSWVRRSAIPLAILIALASIAPVAKQTWSERGVLEGMPDPPGNGPNVLLIILDTVRAHNLSLYGYARETTPWLEELAARGTVFDRAYAQSSWTLPSHGSFFTGHLPHQQSGNTFTPLDATLPTLSEVFRDHGYYTLAIVANSDNAFAHTGLDRGFLRYDAGTAAFWEMVQASSIGGPWRWMLKRLGIYLPTRKDADTVNERFLDSLDRRGERPFFAFLNYYDAHYPFDKPLPPTSSIRGWEDSHVEIVGEMHPGMIRFVDEYDLEIAHLDDRLRALFAALDRQGVLDDTIVIVTSDHGEEFMEHGMIGHGFNVYEITLRVPLIISYPGVVAEGLRVRRPVGLQDLPATISELAGFREAPPFPGRSLLASTEDSVGAGAPVLSEVAVAGEEERTPGPWNYRSLIWGSLHYIHNPDASEEIYDLEKDPWETRDLNTTGSDPPLADFRDAISSLVGDLDVP